MRNIPLILFSLVFLVIAYGLFTTPPRYKPARLKPVTDEVVEVKPDHPYFKGRVIMPDVGDLYVLENTAGRDILKLGKSLQGRAAGLHWLATEHFRNYDKDVTVGLKLSIDSTGHIEFPKVVYCNTPDDDFKMNLISHIRSYWVYPHSKNGKTEFWFPVKWLAKYER